MPHPVISKYLQKSDQIGCGLYLVLCCTLLYLSATVWVLEYTPAWGQVYSLDSIYEV